MQDFVPLGTGNSRFLKSSIPADATWEQARALFRAGQFPTDIGPVNEAGVAQNGDPLNKATLLEDAVAALYGKDEEAVPNDIFQILSKAALLINGKIQDISGNTKALPEVKFFHYDGNGIYGSQANATSLTFPYKPDLFVMYGTIPKAGGVVTILNPLIVVDFRAHTNTYKQYLGPALGNVSDTYHLAKYDDATNTLSWYYTVANGARNQLNDTGTRYLCMIMKGT